MDVNDTSDIVHSLRLKSHDVSEVGSVSVFRYKVERENVPWLTQHY
jgi:hypothetical protein